MMGYNEPPIIKYEKIPIKDEDDKESIEKSSSDESFSSDEDEKEIVEDEKPLSSAMAVEKKRIDAATDKNISRILDFTFIPRKIEENGEKYILRLSRKPAIRDEIIELKETFDKVLKERQVRMQGFCPIRRELYDFLFDLTVINVALELPKWVIGDILGNFPEDDQKTCPHKFEPPRKVRLYATTGTTKHLQDELIRQATINCPERGSLLLRARDEFRMTMATYEKLYESGVTFGTFKALEAEIETRDSDIQYKHAQEEVARTEKRIQDLRAEIDAEEEQSRQRINMLQIRHEEKMDFLKKAHKQLQDQINYISTSNSS